MVKMIEMAFAKPMKKTPKSGSYWESLFLSSSSLSRMTGYLGVILERLKEDKDPYCIYVVLYGNF